MHGAGISQNWLARRLGAIANRVRFVARKLRVKFQSRDYINLTTQEIFERVYREGAWGAAVRDFDSGSGSVASYAEQYAACVTTFAMQHGAGVVVDLGCGDFRVGKSLLAAGIKSYIGVDIVRPLIERLQSTTQGKRARFICADIIKDELPVGDLYLLRQVLQHLSNHDIQAIMSKLAGKRVIVTEHLPVHLRASPNVDKRQGPDIRLYSGSGVFLDQPPFNYSVTTLFEAPAPFNGIEAVLRTSSVVITN